MIEWWQALALSAVTASITGLVAYVIARAQHTWTTGARWEAEQRAETQALETEEREARRQHRRTQVQPILDFVVTLRDFAGRHQVDQISSSLDKHLDNAVVKQVLASLGQPEDMAGELMLPEMDDGLDEVAANQRAITLLQRIQEDDPDLWRTVTELPDGIRAALSARTEQPSPTNESYAQNVLRVERSQAALMTPATMASASSPFDDPRKGETLVLLSAGGVRGCYAVGSSLEPRAISPAQLIAAAECSPDTPAQSLPTDTNERVMAAFEAFNTDFQGRLGRARRPRDTRARGYVSRHLSIAMREAHEEAGLLSRIGVLRQIFLGEVSPQVESALGEIRNLRLEGSVLLTRLEALRERYRLNPPAMTPTDPSQWNPRSSASSVQMA